MEWINIGPGTHFILSKFTLLDFQAVKNRERNRENNNYIRENNYFTELLKKGYMELQC